MCSPWWWEGRLLRGLISRRRGRSSHRWARLCCPGSSSQCGAQSFSSCPGAEPVHSKSSGLKGQVRGLCTHSTPWASETRGNTKEKGKRHQSDVSLLGVPSDYRLLLTDMNNVLNRKQILVYKRFYIYVLQRNLDFTTWAKKRKKLTSTNKLGTDLSPY